MKNYNILSIILLGSILISCNGSKNTAEKYFSFDDSQFKATYHNEDVLSLGLLNAQNKKIDSIIYYVNDKNIGSKKSSDKINFDLKDQKLGYQNLKALVYFEGENQEITSRVELVSSIQPKPLTYTIINTYPHDIKAYTQGLEFYRDTLIEGTGNGSGKGTGIKGISSLRKTDYKTGKVYKIVELPGEIFGEGVTVLNNKIFQLTWQNNEAYIYNANTFKKEKTVPYFKTIEGWGLTNDGTNLLMSDGTEKIWSVNPDSFKEVDYINVYTASTKIKAVNELEWINGKIYANVYQRDAIAIINPKNGAVEAVIDLFKLKSKVTNHPDLDVLNGIAYNPKTQTIFVTGKNWDKMFEIKVNQ
ncbi:glutaminyl-peptide cyclotransferase [Flavobacterium sp. GT3R68]|uniref:glutaminyl-peptide cyclotransferase n=1 Tax=Flavobacterium sp. GT3R68 TaxID=2594437 RepID=UPI000F863AB0|nr:glutaminyl-peptide cyclotransferase [Flavobacterium sp. GT3R68]RTY94944.1 glutaminyl-peptide cyclotransferase [Flavobacterium sp. GSN2]TRW91748.1 glutaminyl-peptide cyclotransferase [Flavobacterium sp. GT3R68]